MDLSQDMVNSGSRETHHVPWALTHSTNINECLSVPLAAQRVNQAPSSQGAQRPGEQYADTPMDVHCDIWQRVCAMWRQQAQ